MDGIIIFYKPKGITSHGAVSFFRKLLNIKRIGHTGTLDPNAEGVLPICIGKATRVSEYLLTEDKEYRGILTLGKSTDTQDGDGKTLESSSKVVSDEDIRRSFNKFKGNISQTPPMYSALKHKGKKLYELAREGKTIERDARDINIYELNIEEIYENKEITFYTKCSRGTYIRTLCNDIGEDLGTFGYMSNLLRVGVGPFNIEDSYKIEDLEGLSPIEIEKLILPIDFALMKFKSIKIEDELYKKLINGVNIQIYNKEYSLGDVLRVYSKNQFIGIGEIIEKNHLQLLKMNKVFV
ncbi:tRNA pseudouridine(55) synthase TruB [Tissierella creatinophila]|uniref:tRNA pseudouridine synthase B n=1 Tax=Tissierella creatinophila DSM 6911 TaxID=1123403 RepID=A0A1U7M3B2_TISCR|nr:tRNA pseudouridine(55) synthase TruB [Tissierella creatinophila]OLS01765.1 tRNA pseudouridine synthase B [Tissierella creatinophila DSM 6911]